MNETISAAAPAADGEASEQCYRQLLPEMQSLQTHELLRINLEITAAVVTALGCAPKIHALMPRLETLADFDLAKVKRLEVYAMALSHAQSRFLATSPPQDNLQVLAAEGALLRDRLLADARALAARGLLNGSRVEKLRGKTGFTNLASDLQILAVLFRQSWTELAGKWGTLEAELDRAEQIAAGVLRAVGARKQRARRRETVSASMRARAFTLFMRAYSEARRGVQYLRWHAGDCNRIAPSLFAGRSNGRGKDAEAQDSTSEAPLVGEAADSTEASSGSETPIADVASRSGTPGANPFLA